MFYKIKLKEYIEKTVKTCVFESVINDVKKTYPNISHLIDNFQSFPTKFIPWIAKQLSKNESDEEKIRNAVSKFNVASNLNKIPSSFSKDINSYRSVDELENMISNISQVTSKTQEKKSIKNEQTLVHFNTKDYSIVEPLSPEASCAYGKHTKWCISGKDAVHHFNDYKKFDIRFYFIITKNKSLIEKPEYEKVAIAFYEKNNFIEIYDAKDNRIQLNDFYDLTYPNDLMSVLSKLTNNTIIVTESIDFVEELKTVENFSDFQQKIFPIFEKNGAKHFRKLFIFLINNLGAEQLAWLALPTTVFENVTLENLGLLDEMANAILKHEPTLLELRGMMLTTSMSYDLRYNPSVFDMYKHFIKRFGKTLYNRQELEKLGSYVPFRLKEPIFKEIIYHALQDQ